MTRSTEVSERLSRLFERGAVVKICGMREPSHAVVAVNSGADLLGFIFAPARRQVTADVARACIEAARLENPDRTFLAVGVFVDASPADIATIVKLAGLDAVQLHGNEAPELIPGLAVPAIKAFRPQPGTSTESVLNELDRFRTALMPPVGMLLDGYTEHGHGGTGAIVDWELAASVAAECNVLLGGALSEENVALAIRTVNPIGVDVSSGVESGGIKDVARIDAFIRAARQAFQR